MRASAIIRDTGKFLKKFGDIVRRSALSTYISALPSTPKDTQLYKIFHRTIPEAPLITSTHPSWTSALLQIIWGYTDSVKSVAFSPDGKKFVSASSDDPVQLWDVETGEAVGAPLTGHTGSICSVAFSPNGGRLASASHDQTVRLWDAETGEAIGAPLSGHTEWVNSVTFSPDGKKLASASNDWTVRLWDVETQEAVGAPLSGHTNSVNLVAFSSDGKKLASASDDKTVRLWDVETREAVGAPVTGHTSSVKSVAFSPDGTKLVSVSADRTERLWDVETLTKKKGTDAGIQIPSIFHTQGNHLSFDDSGFLCNAGKRLVWLPAINQGYKLARQGNTIAVGGHSGSVTIVRFSTYTQSEPSDSSGPPAGLRSHLTREHPSSSSLNNSKVSLPFSDPLAEIPTHDGQQGEQSKL
jgi:WD40 repeat protein